MSDTYTRQTRAARLDPPANNFGFEKASQNLIDFSLQPQGKPHTCRERGGVTQVVRS
jgi:hypothetical protein